jgi:hypothetical protein
MTALKAECIARGERAAACMYCCRRCWVGVPLAVNVEIRRDLCFKSGFNCASGLQSAIVIALAIIPDRMMIPVGTNGT